MDARTLIDGIDCDDLEDDLWQAHLAGDRHARDMLIVCHLHLAHGLAARYSGRGIESDDLLQVAAVGLLRAIDRFDPTRGVPFVSFAVPTILGELRRHFRDRGWVISLPRTLQDLASLARQTAAELEQRDGQTPTAELVAAELEVELPDVLFALGGARSCFRPGELPPELPPGDEDDSLDDAIEAHELMRTLEPRERLVVYLRFWGDLSQQEIADQIGVSQVHVSRLLRHSLGKMEKESGARADRPAVS
jgi:RNA polymerase sigma-B factor